MTSNHDETLPAECVDLDGALERAAEDGSHVLPDYEQIVGMSQGSVSTVPCPKESSYLTKDYSSLEERHCRLKPNYTSLLTTL